jgi:hypothetical protein
MRNKIYLGPKLKDEVIFIAVSVGRTENAGNMFAQGQAVNLVLRRKPA